MSSASIFKAIQAALLAGALGALAGCSSEPEQLAVEGSAKAAKLEQCVEPTDFMRRNHMELIKHQRVETVRDGVRLTDNSLAGCIDCHVQYDVKGAPVPVNAQGQFCSGCHEYAAVSLDCFQCHSSTPNSVEGGMAMSSMQPRHGSPHTPMLASFADESVADLPQGAGVK